MSWPWNCWRNRVRRCLIAGSPGTTKWAVRAGFADVCVDWTSNPCWLVPSHTSIRDREVEAPVGTGRGRPLQRPWQSVSDWAEAQPAHAWTKRDVRDAAQGPLLVEAIKCRVRTRDEKRRECPDDEVLVVIRYRDRDRAVTKIEFSLSNASPDTPLAEFARAAKAEHRIEECLQRAKSEAGLADYDVRHGIGWQHHQTLSLIATWFLTTESRRGKKWTLAMTLPQIREGLSQILQILHRACGCDTSSRLQSERETRLQRNELARLYHWKQHNQLATLNLSKRQI